MVNRARQAVLPRGRLRQYISNKWQAARTGSRNFFSTAWQEAKKDVWGALKDAGSTAGKAAWHEGIKPAGGELWKAGKTQKDIHDLDKKIFTMAGSAIPANERRKIAGKIVKLQGKDYSENYIIQHFAYNFKQQGLGTQDMRGRMQIIKSILFDIEGGEAEASEPMRKRVLRAGANRAGNLYRRSGTGVRAVRTGAGIFYRNVSGKLRRNRKYNEKSLEKIATVSQHFDAPKSLHEKVGRGHKEYVKKKKQ